MAPFPDEVDVFTGPHWRMKQLVGLYCEKVRMRDSSAFSQTSDKGIFEGLLLFLMTGRQLAD